MKKITTILFAITTTLILSSCGNEVEEIKNPTTGKLLKRYEYYTDDSGQKIKDGTYVEWNAVGNKIAELHYQDDSLNGPCTYYNEDGSVFKENYKNGVLDGQQTYYYSSGKKQTTGSYSSGKQTSSWKYYDDKGKLAFTLNFKNGICQELVGTWQLEEARQTTFTFFKDGTFEFKAPTFKNFGEPVLQGKGPVYISNILQLLDEKRGTTWEYEIFAVEKNRLILINPNADVEEAILGLKRSN